ncbi:MAG TPA: bifunctional 4-hydroxy-3-methylbut-2-enyl diphosphate reductase/30S ribosomal protein S1, partial [Oscillospiraceae bacterium]|nr:bifunctional 4-hydroxy-3-methylbut-2-enyl diphosphate reductase/30S ribosomal protein S1 [Oscillospiraceae bacterium]
MKELILAESAGFCYGVKRAVDLVEAAAAEGKKAVMLGPVIHNAILVDALGKKGIPCVSHVEDVPPGTAAIIRSHGEGADVYESLSARGIPVLDATCPNVAHIHRIVAGAEKQGRQAVVIGTRTHPEVRAIAAWCKSPLVFENASELDEWLSSPERDRTVPVTMVSQTTSTRGIWDPCVENLKKQCTNCEIFDTICGATAQRQTEAQRLAARCDAMIVIGDPKSSNTKRLAELCAAECPLVLRIEQAEELDPSRFEHARVVGITAGASTPAWVIKEVYDKMSEEIKDMGSEEITNVEKEESFAELLEQSIKTLNNGEKVTGTVTAVTPTEIQMDVGTKHACYIPVDEFTDDPSANINELVKVGDEIEAFVVRVNDVEGVATLSKKRLDTVKSWDDIEAAGDEHAIVEGIVTEENKGGIVVSVRGVRVFVPASQTGLPKDTPMSELIKKKVKLRITEVNRSRRRAVGSIRAVLFEERRAASEKVWNEIEAGKHYDGTVKSLTSYGAFVDIGGVDGMVHISELSWSRIKHPSEVVAPGDKVDVYVIGFDKEKKKISLGMKDRSKDPWTVFTGTYGVGSVAEVRVVKLMTFGAFAEIVPGVDGLIHISQMAMHRIDKPSDVVHEGDKV